MLYPMFAMVILTLLVLGYTAFVRVRSVQRRQVHPNYFKLMEGPALPAHVAQAGRHFSNLLETPLLFYIGGVVAMVMHITGSLILTWAWIYVGSRILHAAIHLSYNNPLHRMLAFMLSIVCILAMWIILVSAAQGIG